METTPLLLNWRDLVCSASMDGLVREIAAGSEVVELTDDAVLLRPVSHLVLGPDTALSIGSAISSLKRHSFTVVFTAEDRKADAPTVSRLEESKARAARLAMIDAFKSDPFVQKCVEFFSGTVDETSVRSNSQEEKGG